MILNADCLLALTQIASNKPDCIITDPPYGVLPKGKPGDNFSWDSFQGTEHLLEFTREWFNMYFDLLQDNGWMFVFWSQKYLREGLNLFNPSRVLLWEYNNLTLGGNGAFAYNYEPIFVIRKGNPKLIAGKHSCILKYTKPQSNFVRDKLVHPTQKPLELYKHLIKITDKSLYLDMFAGSGTLAAACIESTKSYICIEKDPNYFALLQKRINSYSTPTLFEEENTS